MTRCKFKLEATKTVSECFEDFLLAKEANNISEKTLQTYRNHFSAICKFIEWRDSDITSITTNDINRLKVNMRNSKLLPSSVASYIRTVKSFFSWCVEEGFSSVVVSLYHVPETYKEVYTEEELQALMRKPQLNKCQFAEYRDWVIVSFLMSCGARASTIRNIKNRDVNIAERLIYFRHTKNKKIQFIPISTQMLKILKDYMSIRKGSEDDWLFPAESDIQMSENCLRCAISDYNIKRGVKKTSVHLFRHTFAKMFVLNGGNPLMLQNILGHSTLDMTKHYFNSYGKLIVNNYDVFSPLDNIVSTHEKKIKMR